jgi:hypothetical protein
MKNTIGKIKLHKNNDIEGTDGTRSWEFSNIQGTYSIYTLKTKTFPDYEECG